VDAELRMELRREGLADGYSDGWWDAAEVVFQVTAELLSAEERRLADQIHDLVWRRLMDDRKPALAGRLDRFDRRTGRPALAP
jgi:hypothetical protein